MPFIVRNSSIPRMLSVFISIYAITLFPFIFIKDDGDNVTITHESIHIKQQQELYVVGFYILYIWDWVRGLIKYKNIQVAYYKIRFEQEAYEFDYDIQYPENRKKFSWKKYKL